MNLHFETTFVVMPSHCNYHYPMIFGGAFFSEMDLCAAQCISRLLHHSECDAAVTHRFSGVFHAPAECGDIVFLEATITDLRKKAINVHVIAYREHRGIAGKDHIADGDFVFVTKKDDKFAPHGLQLPKVDSQ